MRGMVPRIRELGVIANPLPPELPDRALAARVRDARGRYRLMAMGRLVPAKKFELLIGAFAELDGEFPALDLAIWGEGPMRDALTEQIKRAGMRHPCFCVRPQYETRCSIGGPPELCSRFKKRWFERCRVSTAATT